MNKIRYRLIKNDFYYKKFIKEILIIGLLMISCLVFILITLSIFPVNKTENISIIENINVEWIYNKTKIISILLGCGSLGFSSFLIQRVSKNKLADTNILGISASNAVVMIILFSLGVGDFVLFKYLSPIIVIIVSILITLVIYYMGFKKNKQHSMKIIITGIVINFLMIAIGNTFSNSTMANNPVFEAMPYLAGQLPIPSVGNYEIYFSLVLFVVSTIWYLLINRRFVYSEMNYEISKLLNIKPTSTQLQILMISALLSSASFILIGNISFLGIFSANITFLLINSKKTSSFLVSIFTSILISLISNFLVSNCFYNIFLKNSYLIALISGVFLSLLIKFVKKRIYYI